MSKHGAWHYDEVSDDGSIIDENGCCIATVMSPDDFPCTVEPAAIERGWQEHKANRTLIAQAPAMLEALKAVIDAAQTDSDTCAICLCDLARHASGCVITAVEAIVAKAEPKPRARSRCPCHTTYGVNHVIACCDSEWPTTLVIDNPTPLGLTVDTGRSDESDLRRLREFVSHVKAAMPNIAQLIDGWLNTPAPEWSEWDKSVRSTVTVIALETEGIEAEVLPLLDQKNAEIRNYEKMLDVVREVCEYDMTNRKMRQRLNAAMQEFGFDNEPEAIE